MAIVTYLRNQPLEETRETFVARHLGQNLEAALRVIKVPILDTSLDNVERSRNNERGRGTRDRRNEVLEPAGLVVVLEPEEVLLGECGSSEKLIESVSPTPQRL